MQRKKPPVLIVLFCAASLAGGVAAQDFTAVTEGGIVSEGRYAEGASWGDVNGDGHADLFVPHLHEDRTNALYLSDGEGSFTEVTSGPVVSTVGQSTGGFFGDIDNDGDLDLFVARYFGVANQLFLNDGTGRFEAATETPMAEDAGFSFGASLVDYDQDGWLDIFVVNGFQTLGGEANYLYRNDGDGTFRKVTTGAIVTEVAGSSNATWADYDGDGDADVFVANGGGNGLQVQESFLYENNGDGTFAQHPASALGIATTRASNGSWADYDNDGDFDLLVTNFLGQNNDLYQNNGEGTFTRVREGVLVADGGDTVSSAWGDYDNDGWLDVYVTNDFNEDNILYHNGGDGTFTRVLTELPSQEGGRSNGATWHDVDQDGFLDLYVPNGQRPEVQSNRLYRNEGRSGHHWIQIHCVGTASNRAALGAEVRVWAQLDGQARWQLRQVAGTAGFNAQPSLTTAFGVQRATQVDSVVITWPSGQVDRYADLRINTHYTATEGAGIAPRASPLEKEIPTPGFALSNHPNPFRQATTLSYTLPVAGPVSVEVYDLLGRRVARQAYRYRAAGTHPWVFEAPQAAGQYLVRLTVEGRVVAARWLVQVR